MTHALASRQRGLTLIEAMVVIMLTGIVGAMASSFIPASLNAYLDQARRGEMSDQADGALRRMARELQTALPNSVRVNAAGTYLEFLPVRAAGRYRAAPDNAGVGNFLDFASTSDDTFDVLGPAVSVSAGDQLVVYNLGLVGADAYAGTSRRALISTGGALGTLQYAVAGTQFPYASPNNRFHIVNRPVTYVCAPSNGTTGTLRRYSGYATQAAQPTNANAAPLSLLSGANNALLTGTVTACSFTYNTTSSARNAVVTMRLTLTHPPRQGSSATMTESISLLQQVHVESSP